MASPKASPRKTPRATVTNTARAAGPASVRRVSDQFNDAFALSPDGAAKLTSSLLGAADRPLADRLADAGELVHWASAPAAQAQRRSLIAGFREAGADLVLVHHMAQLPREQTAAFVKQYLGEGGSLIPILQWLGIAGNVLRAPRAAAAARAAWTVVPRGRGQRGLFDKFADGLAKFGNGVIDGVKKVGSGVVDAAGSLVDAVIGAGKTLADAVGDALNWTVDQLTDLVGALLKAGRQVGEILAAAAAKSLDQLRKYVEAVLAAGRSVGDVLGWAVTQAADRAAAVVGKLLALGRSILDLLKTVLALGRNAMVAVARALLASANKPGELIAALAGQSLALAQAVLDALLAVGQSLASLLVEVAKQAAATVQLLVEALLALGTTLGDLLLEAARAAGQTLRIVVQAALAIGRTLTQLLSAAAALAAGTAKQIVEVLLALGKSLAEIVAAATNLALAAIKAVFGALLALGKKVVEILVALTNRSLSALRAALEGLLAMGVSLVMLVGDILSGVEQAFHRSFFEGLVALGKTPLQLMKAAIEARASLALLGFGAVLELCGGYRPLDKKTELPDATKVFGAAVQLDRVKLGFAALPEDVIRFVNIELPRAFTTMYLINFGPGADHDMQTIIHELGHVWQGSQQGPLYMTRALEAQWAAGFTHLFHKGTYDDSASYRVTAAALAANGGNLAAFNPEQQATIIEFFWIQRYSNAVDPAGFPWTVNRGVVVPPVEALLPYAQKINPSLRLPPPHATTAARAARATKKPAPARRAQRAKGA